MFCTKCGAQQEDNVVFCSKCGTQLKQSEQTTTPVIETQKQPIKQAEVKSFQMAKSNPKQIGCVVLLLIVGVGIWALTQNIMNSSPKANVDATQNQSAQNTSATDKDLAMVDFKWKSNEYGNRLLVGHVKNNSTKTYGYVQISFNLYDETGSQVGSTMANVNNLEPKSTWKFEAIVIQDNATKARFKDIVGY